MCESGIKAFSCDRSCDDKALMPLDFMTDPKHRNNEKMIVKQKELVREWIISIMINSFSLVLTCNFQEAFLKLKMLKTKFGGRLYLLQKYVQN